MFLKPRRTLLKKLFLLISASLLCRPLLASSSTFLNTIDLVQHDLYSKRTGTPTLKQINAKMYLQGVLNQERVTQGHKEFIRNGVKWLDEESVLMYKKSYIFLTASQRQNILHGIAKESWGENWIDTMLTYIYEAMLSDPIYGGNKNGVGWKWLNHSSGLPQPKKALV